MEEQLASRISDGFEVAKNGNALPVYQFGLPYLEIGQLPARSHYAFGWIIYYALHQQPNHEISERKKMLASYLKLSVTKPHKLHSMILLEAMRLYKDAKDVAFNAKGNDVPRFSIVKFAELWNLSHLRPGDWRRKEYEGKESFSTAEKFITLYVDEVEEANKNGEAITPKSPNQAALSPSPQFIAVIDSAVAEFPDSFNLLAQRAALHAISGETDSARSLLKKALLYAPGKFFLWSRLANLYNPSIEPRKHVALLYKALRSPGQEQFKGRIRLSLAEAFVLKNLHHFALWELNKVKQTYEGNGWHLPRAYVTAVSKIPSGTMPENPELLYRRLEPLADNEVYDALPIVKVTKTYHKNPDPNALQQNGRTNYSKPSVAWRVTDAQGNNYWLQPHRFKIPAGLPLGTHLNIRLHNGRPVKAELSTPHSDSSTGHED